MVVVVVVRWPIHARIGPFTRHTFADQGDRGKGALATPVDCARLQVVGGSEATRRWVLCAVGEWESGRAWRKTATREWAGVVVGCKFGGRSWSWRFEKSTVVQERQVSRARNGWIWLGSKRDLALANGNGISQSPFRGMWLGSSKSVSVAGVTRWNSPHRHCPLSHLSKGSLDNSSSSNFKGHKTWRSPAPTLVHQP